MSPRNYWDAYVHRGHSGMTQRSTRLRDAAAAADDDDDDDYECTPAAKIPGYASARNIIQD